MTIKFKRLSEKAVTPVRATDGSAGYDLTASQITTEVNERGQLIIVYHSGIAVEIPEGFMGQVYPRSSICNKTLRMCNSVGIIDSDYRGEITAKFISTTDVIPAVYKEGDRFAQIVFTKCEDVEFVESDELSATERGDGSYGSTNNTSAADVAESPSKDEDMSTNSEATTSASGGEENVPEQA